MEDGVDGYVFSDPVLEWVTVRRGDEGLRSRAGVLVETPRIGELLRLSPCLLSGSRTDERTGEMGGKASSMGFLGIRTRLGEPEGLAGRRCCGEYKMWPEPLTPGMDCVRDMGGARLVVERDREWAPESGEALRGRYGMKVDEGHEGEAGEAGEMGLGSVLRLTLGLRTTSMSSVEAELGL